MQGCNTPWNAGYRKSACGICNVLLEVELRRIYSCIFSPGLHLQGHTYYLFSLLATQDWWWILWSGRDTAGNTARTLTLKSTTITLIEKTEHLQEFSSLRKHIWIAQAELRQDQLSVGQTGQNTFNCLKTLPKTSESNYHSHVVNQGIDWHLTWLGGPETISSFLCSAGKLVPCSLEKINPCLGQIQI